MALSPLRANETVLVGAWVDAAIGVFGDETCKRIEALIRDNLKHVADHPKHGAWKSLYRDPGDGRFWERTYPNGELHGGGPPTIRSITEAEAKDTNAL